VICILHTRKKYLVNISDYYCLTDHWHNIMSQKNIGMKEKVTYFQVQNVMSNSIGFYIYIYNLHIYTMHLQLIKYIVTL
jgi:hypothetical protein